MAKVLFWAHEEGKVDKQGIKVETDERTFDIQNNVLGTCEDVTLMGHQMVSLKKIIPFEIENFRCIFQIESRNWCHRKRDFFFKERQEAKTFKCHKILRKRSFCFKYPIHNKIDMTK